MSDRPPGKTMCSRFVKSQPKAQRSGCFITRSDGSGAVEKKLVTKYISSEEKNLSLCADEISYMFVKRARYIKTARYKTARMVKKAITETFFFLLSIIKNLFEWNFTTQ